MNYLLGFSDKSNDKRYYSDLKSHLQMAQNVIALNLLFKEVLYQVILASASSQEYLTESISLIVSSVINMIALVVVVVIKKKNRQGHPLFGRLQPKFATWIVDTFFFILAFLLILCQFFQGNVKQFTPVDGWIWAFSVFYLSFLIFNWLPKALLFSIFLLVGAFSWDNPDSDQQKKTQILKLSLNSVMALIIYYNVEKYKKKKFLMREVLLEKSDVWKRMINKFPEGLMLVNMKGEVLFCNQELEKELRQKKPDEKTNNVSNNNCRESNLVSLDDLKSFSNVSVAFCDSQLRIMIDQEECVPHQKLPFLYRNKDLSSIIKRIFLKVRDPSPSQQQGATTENRESFVSNLPNDQELLLLDAHISENTGIGHASPPLATSYARSFQIKFWFTFFEKQQTLVLLFSETTHMKLIHRLQDRDAYRTRLLASISHEFRTPLNGSINFMERVAEDVTIPADIKEMYVIPAIRSNRILLYLINDLLDFSQIQFDKLQLTFERANIVESLNECQQLYGIQASLKGISLPKVFIKSLVHDGKAQKKKTPSSAITNSSFDPLFCTDHRRLQQIILNLISNAIKFSYQGSEIRLVISELGEKTGLMTADEKKKLDKQNGRLLKIEVQDSGVGISTEAQERLLQEINEHTDHNSIKNHYDSSDPNGVSLGLTISNVLAVQLGGLGLSVLSEEGVGSTFSFILAEKSCNTQLISCKSSHDDEEGEKLMIPSHIQNHHILEFDVAQRDDHFCSKVSSYISIPFERATTDSIKIPPFFWCCCWEIFSTTTTKEEGNWRILAQEEE
jgi:signal transduction histidine kinase